MFDRDTVSGITPEEMLAPGRYGAGANAGGLLDYQQSVGQVLMRLDATLVGGTDPVADFVLWESNDGVTYTENITTVFTPVVAGVGIRQSVRFDPRLNMRYQYGILTVGGTNTPLYDASILSVRRNKVV